MTAFSSSFMSLPCQSRNPILNNSSSSLTTTPSKLVTFNSLSFSSNLSRNKIFSKGCLTMRTLQKPSHHSVVCMARRYASNSWRRQIKSRRRGGDPDKKKKRRRKGGTKKKDTFKIVRLVSAAGTGSVYFTKKSRVVGKTVGKKSKNVKQKSAPKKVEVKEKLELRKYDPQLHRHVVFTETK